MAGISFAYYARLEQGYGEGMSTKVLDAVARALRLTQDERAHLIRLAQTESYDPARAECREELRPTVRHLLDALGVPALVVGRRMDILGQNRLATAVFGLWETDRPEEHRLPRIFFLTPEAHDRYVDPGRVARGIVGLLRAAVGYHPGDPHLAALVGELSERCEEFRLLWAQQNVECGHGTIRMRHPLVGEFALVAEPMTLSGGGFQRLFSFHAAPGSASEKALQELAAELP